MDIRLAKKEDLEKIIEIEQVCFPIEEAAKAEDLKERFEVFGDCFMVAISHQEIIGFINGCTTDLPLLPDELYHNPLLHMPNGKYQTVFGLDVLPSYRGQAVAEKLLNSFIELAKQRGKKGIVLTCKDHLIHYYQRFGFVHMGVSSSSHGGAIWNDMVLEF